MRQLRIERTVERIPGGMTIVPLLVGSKAVERAAPAAART